MPVTDTTEKRFESDIEAMRFAYRELASTLATKPSMSSSVMIFIPHSESCFSVRPKMRIILSPYETWQKRNNC